MSEDAGASPTGVSARGARILAAAARERDERGTRDAP